MSNPLIDRDWLSRRNFLRYSSLASGALGLSSWMPALANAVAQQRKSKHCILLWMAGGPSQMDTFDLKPNHANGGEFREIATSVPGLKISEHLPKLAKLADHLAIVRGMSTREGDHGRGTYLMRTGRPPGGPVKFPTLGSTISKEIGNSQSALPQFVSIASHSVFNPEADSPGFLGPKHAPLRVQSKQARFGPGISLPEFGVDNLFPARGVSVGQSKDRIDLLKKMQEDQLRQKRSKPCEAHTTTLERAIQLMKGKESRVFDLSQEPADVRERYGPTVFGQGCLLARRLVEAGVSFVEVGLGNSGVWDTHTQNFPTVKTLSNGLDAGWSALLTDLKERRLLDSTTILWMGEFGRTPRINGSAGRDHFPAAWTSVLAGGGIKGGQAYGKTSKDGMSVTEGLTEVDDLLATLCRALEIDPRKQNLSDIGRPFRIAEGKPIDELLQSK